MTIREIAELMNMRKNRVKLILREYIFDGYRVKSWEERRKEGRMEAGKGEI